MSYQLKGRRLLIDIISLKYEIEFCAHDYLSDLVDYLNNHAQLSHSRGLRKHEQLVILGSLR